MPGQFVGPRQAILYGNVRIPYLLYDAFNDNLVAGAVNGTKSTPPASAQVSGTLPARTVTDTLSKLSIANGVANFLAGASAMNNPLLIYPAITRALGRTLLYAVFPSVTTNEFVVGLSISATPNNYNQYMSVYFASSARLFALVTTGERLAGVYTATAYQLAISLRASGCYMFVKGGAFSNWTMLWASTVDSTASLYPFAISYDVAFAADNIRVPVSLYIPTPLAYDTFTRANGALGNSETSGPDAQAVTARGWTGATFAIATNIAVNTPSLGADVIVNGGFGTDTDWTKGAGWSIAAGVAAAVTATSDLTAAVAPLVVGTWYSVTYTLSGFGAGTVNAKLGSTAFPTHAANATYTETGLALTTAFAFTGVGFTGSIDDVSCKPLTLAELFATMAPGIADVMLDINCTMVSATGAGKQIGIVSNLNSAASPTDFRLTILDGRGNVVVYDCIAGVYTVKATTAVTYSAAAPLRVITEGMALSRFYNSLLVGTQQTMGANTNALCGIFSTSPLSSQDVWQAFSRGADAAYVGLDAY